MPQPERELKPDIPSLFTQQGEKYEKYANNSFSWEFIERPLFDKKISTIIDKQSIIVDAGCGPGRILNYLTNLGLSASNLTGIDINKKMLEAASKNSPGVKLIQADLENIPLESNSTDLVIANHIFHFFDERKFLSTLSSFHRILKPEGKVFWLIAHPVRTRKEDPSLYFKREWIMDSTPWGTKSPLHYKPVSDLLNLTIQAGFEITSVIEPEVAREGKAENETDYEKYASTPPRLAVIAKKPIE